MIKYYWHRSRERRREALRDAGRVFIRFTGKYGGKHVEYCNLFHGLPTPAMRAWIDAGASGRGP